MATTTVDLGPVIGPQGPAGEVDPTTPIPFSTPAADADMASGDRIDTLFGKIKKRLSVLVDKIGDLSTLTTTAKDSTVAAINDLNNNLSGKADKIGRQTISMLNGATGSLFYYKINAETYLLSGYISATSDTWFANFPAVPSSIYPNSAAKVIGVNPAGDVVAININASRGMTVPSAGSYWITGIVVCVS